MKHRAAYRDGHTMESALHTTEVQVLCRLSGCTEALVQAT